jgi:glycosyltransferase involved in cell wall biosynthesis
VVAYLGTLTPRKRVEMLVRAFASLGGKATLVIGGNDMGAGESVQTTIAQLGVAARTVVTGLLEGRERLELLADADVVVYPSEHEIFGLVPLEALLAGTPVVVANDSGCGEVIASTGGGLVVPGDVAAIASAIEHVLGAPAHWRTAAVHASRRVRATYAAEHVCARLEAVYREVAAAA